MIPDPGASLNHPNIVEETASVKALVMELVEGPTLAERLAQGSAPRKSQIPNPKSQPPQIHEGRSGRTHEFLGESS
jgi:hypothetical protein